jgi:3-deoxy-D-manno-octulosonic acid (KDO) 8-phosphate synthase
MEKFILISNIVIGSDLEANVCLKPSSILIEDYIATYKVYESEAVAILDIPSFITEQTPLLFNVFKEMTNVPIEIRNQFEL